MGQPQDKAYPLTATGHWQAGPGDPVPGKGVGSVRGPWDLTRRPGTAGGSRPLLALSPHRRAGVLPALLRPLPPRRRGVGRPASIYRPVGGSAPQRLDGSSERCAGGAVPCWDRCRSGAQAASVLSHGVAAHGDQPRGERGAGRGGPRWAGRADSPFSPSLSSRC